MSREKNPDMMIEAFDAFLASGHDAVLVMVGDGPYREELQARTRGRPVVFTGFLEGEDLAAAFASADALVFPSTTDTFGNVVLEAQASGLPVIVMDRGGPAEIVRRHESGIIVGDTVPQGLSEAMERLYLDADLRADLRARGLRNASESSWQHVLDDLWRDQDDLPAEVDAGPSSSYRSPDPGLAAGVIAMNVP